MTELSMFWNGTTVGDATSSPYDADTEFADVMTTLAMASAVANQGGVIRNALNALLATGASSPVSVDTGLAMVHGSWYRNDAAVSFSIPSSSGADRIDLIVLRKSWAAQTVRLTWIEGTPGGSAPALTQIAGTTWDIPLFQLTVTSGGVITIVSQRDFLPNVATGVVTTDAAQTITGTKTFNADTIKSNGALDAASVVGASLARPTYWVKITPAIQATTVSVPANATTVIGLPSGVPPSALMVSLHVSRSTGVLGVVHFSDAASDAANIYELTIDGTLGLALVDGLVNCDSGTPCTITATHIGGSGGPAVTLVVDAYMEYM